jgi:superfamily I DNA/RNA helicase
MTLTDAARAIVEYTGAHLRVLGPPGSGKTSLLAERFRWLESRGRRPAAITYTNAARERLVAALLPADSARFGRLPVYTYHQLVAHVLREDEPAGRAPLGEVEETAVLERVVEDALSEMGSDYRSVARAAGFQRTLLATIHALLQHGLTAAGAERAMGSAHARARDVLRIFARYARTLESAGLATFYDAAWRAADAVAREPRSHPLRDADVLLVDDFGDVDAGQFRLVEALAPADGGVEVGVFGDPTGERFGFRGTSARFLLEVFPERYQPRTAHLAPPRRGHAALDAAVGALSAALGAMAPGGATEHAAPDAQLALDFGKRPGAVDTRVPGNALAVSFALAADEVAEAQGVAEEAARLVTSGSARADEIAVLARDPHRYRAALERAFAERGVPFDSGRRRHHALDDLTDSLLALLAVGGDEHRLYAVATSPWFDALARAVGVERGAQASALEDAERVVEATRRMASRGRRAFDMGAFMSGVVRPLVTGLDGTLDPRSLAWVASLEAAWSRYRDAMARVGATTRLEQFRRLHRAHFESDRAPGCAALLSARETSALSFPVVFVVGCAEGIFPTLEARESYIPYEDIAACVGGECAGPVRFHAARTRDEQLRDEHALLLTALTRAAGALRVSAPREMQGEVLSGATRALAGLASEAGGAARERHVGPELAAPVAVAAGRGRFGADTPVPDGALAVERAWLAPAPAASPFALRRFPMSPSALDNYCRCARKFFYTRALRIRTEEMVPGLVGNLFHTLLEGVARDFPSREALVTGLGDEEIAGRVDDVLSSRRAAGLGPASSLLKRLARVHMIRMAVEFRELERDRKSEYCIADPEERTAFDRGGFAFSGRIDRVDVLADGTRVVVDYKTGKISRKTAKSIWGHMTQPEGGGDRYWQVPFYCHALAEAQRMPDAFVYYLLPVGEDVSTVAGFLISEDRARAPLFASAPPNRFREVSPAAVGALMDGAVVLAGEIFAERADFPRTERTGECRSCDFAGVCDRRRA